MDDGGLHRGDDPGRRGHPGRAAGDHPLDDAAWAGRHGRQAAARGTDRARRQGRHRGRRLRRPRPRPVAGRPDRRPGAGRDDPALHRVRPAAAVRRRPPQQGQQDGHRQRQDARPQDRDQPVRGAGGPGDRLAAHGRHVPQAKGDVMNAITIVILAVALALSPAAAAQQSELGGKVRSGREVTVPATETVQGDLVASGGTVRIDGRVDGDLVASGGQVIVDGTVTGNVLGSTGNYSQSGSVGGSERVNIDQPEAEQEPTLADRAVDAVRRYVSILVVGALLLWLLPRLLRGAADGTRGRPLVAFGVGILGFIGTIVALVLVVLVTVLVAIVLGLLGLGSLTGLTVFGGLLVTAIVVFLLVLAVAFAAQATVGLALGRLLLPGLDRSFLSRFGALALGVPAVVLVAAIPVVGGVLEALLVLLGLGGLLLMATPARRRLAEP